MFSEHGAFMAATILNSTRAFHMSVYVVRAFVKMRESLLVNAVLARELAALKTRVDSLDADTKERLGFGADINGNGISGVGSKPTKVPVIHQWPL